MATSLGQQLRQLQVARAVHDHRPRGKPSLLFTPLEAADIDAESLLELAQQALQQLSVLDGIFASFTGSLFAPATTSIDRLKCTKEENQEYDSQITRFVGALGPHFLLPASFKVLEYLIRVYGVHERNVDVVLSTFIPYHQTGEFVRLVQICHLEDSRWQFLAGMKANGAALPRDALVQHCRRDHAVLRAICEAAQDQAAHAKGAPVYAPFFALVLSETVSVLDTNTEGLMRLLLPYVTRGVASDNPSYRAASFIVLGAACRCRALNITAAETLLEAALTGVGPELATQAAMLVVAVCHAGVKQLSGKTLWAVARLPGLPRELASLSAAGVPVSCVLLAVSAGLAQGALHHHEFQTLIKDLLSEVPMTEDIAREMCAALLAAAAAAPKESQRESGALAALLRHADAHHPVAVSRAVTAALRPGQGAHLEQFLADALAGSPRAPLKGSPETVADAVDASNAALRARAVAALDACADVAWARAAALRRVQDDSHEVVIAALRTRLVREAPPEALATAAEGSLRVRVPVLLSRKPAKGADLDGCRGACKRLIKALGRVASEGGAVGSGALASMVDLLAVPAASQLRPVAVVAAEQLSKSGVLPFSAMGDVSKRVDEAVAAAEKTVSKESAKKKGGKGKGKSKEADKEKSKGADKAARVAGDVAATHAMIQALASGIQKSPAEAGAALSTVCAAGGRRTAYVAVLALSEAARQRSSADACVRAALEVMRPHWASLRGTEPPDRTIEGALPTDEDLAELRKRPAEAEGKGLCVGVAACLAAGGAGSAEHAREALASAQGTPLAAGVVAAAATLGAAFLAGVASDASLPVAARVGALRGVQGAPAGKDAPSLLACCIQWLSDAEKDVRAAASDVASSAVAAGSVAPAAAADLLAALCETFGGPPGSPGEAVSAARALLFGKRWGTGKQRDAVVKHLAAEIAASGADPARAGVSVAALEVLVGDPEGLRDAEAAKGAAEAALAAACDALGKTLGRVGGADPVPPADTRALAALALALASATPSAAAMGAVPPGVAPVAVALLETRQEALGPARAAAAASLPAGAFASAAPEERPRILEALVASVASDPSEDVVAAARAALEKVPLAAEDVAPLLLGPAAAVSGEPRRKKRAASRSVERKAYEDAVASEARLARATSALELLAGGREVIDEADLVPHVCGVLEALRSAAPAGPEASDDAGEESEARAGVGASYASRLGLSWLAGVVGRGGAAAAAVSVEMALSAAGAGRDAAETNEALALIEALARARPDAVLEHTLEVLSLVGRSAEASDDSHSHAVAAAVLRAIGPIWAQSGRPMGDLARALVGHLGRVVPHRRLPLLEAFVRSSVDSAEALPTILSTLLSAAPEAEEGADSWHAGLARDVALGATGDEIGPALERLLAATAGAGSDLGTPLSVVAAAFAADILLDATESHSLRDCRQEPLQRLMQLALEQIADATAQASKRADAAVARALEAAADSRRALLDALQSAMDPPALLSQAAALAASPREEVARRAVTLLTRRVVSLASEPPSARELVMTRAEKAEREALVSEAALSALAPLQETVRKGRTPGTVQGALQAVDALAKAFGGQSGERFVPAAAAVAAALGNATSAAVRGSALVTLAAVTTTVGARALPQLPVMMGAVLAAAEAAAAWMSEHRSSGEDDEEEDEAKKGREEGLLVAASSIAALLAAAEALPQFLSPYLGRILHIAVHPGFSKDPSCVTAVSSLRAALCGGVPPWQLVPALSNKYEAAFKTGPEAAKGILGMMANVLVTLDGPAAAAMAGTVTTTCLGALTALSEGQGEEGTGHDEQGAFGVEEAAVGAFVALALRLPEREFRPQFQRVVQWGTAQGPSGPMPARRVGSLFSVAHALAQRLRSVFVPYFAGLWGTACVALGAPAEAVAGEEGKGKKKREKKKRRGTEAAVEGSGEEMARMRVSVLRALASCFVADTVGFVTMERVESLLPGIAAQLAEESPAAGMGEELASAVVEAVGQLAMVLQDDAQRKPLNHKCLMATRSPFKRSRLLGLACLSRIADRLKEEYLPFVPESIPFLSELLEDPEQEVEKRAQELVKELESLTGESLEPYLKV